VLGECVISRPLTGCQISSSIVIQPVPWMKPPSTWPISIVGFSERRASCSRSARSAFHAPVSESTSTSLTAPP